MRLQVQEIRYGRHAAARHPTLGRWGLERAWRLQQGAGVHIDLTSEDLSETKLSGTNLSKADLSRTNLTRSSLTDADLSDADLREANLQRANLNGANLNRANLAGANLRRAILREADLREAKGIPEADFTDARVGIRTLRDPGTDLRGARFVGLAAPYDPTALAQTSIERLRIADPRDVQEIAAEQIGLLDVYRREALRQSQLSFWVALCGSVAGLALFVAAVAVSLLHGLQLASVVPLVAGAVVEIVSGVVFYLYGQTSSQLSAFHSRLEVLQHYMLANSICESLSETERDKARAALIGEISRAPADQPRSQ